MIRQFIAVNRRMCRAVDRLLPSHLSVDGNRRFKAEIVPRYVKRGASVIDVGGGKTPFFGLEQKSSLNLCVVGVDVAYDELALAPRGAYDVAVVGDICASPFRAAADLIVCMTVLEHVHSTAQAVREMSRLVRPGGTVALLVPGRNALFAQLNRLLPEGVKRPMLQWIYPEARGLLGFPASYDRCTPSALERIARDAGFEVVEREVYNWSGYFDFFFRRISAGVFSLSWPLPSLAMIWPIASASS